MIKIDARKISADELHAKLQSVIALYIEGIKVMQIVKQTGLSWPTVNKAIKQHKEKRALEMPAQRGRKVATGRTLDSAQEARIFEIICTKRPWKCGIGHLPYKDKQLSLWSNETVMELIERECNVKLSARCVNNYLRRWGFTSTTPKHRNKSHSNKIKALGDQYKETKERAKTENADIFWMQKPLLANPPTSQQNENDASKSKKKMYAVTSNQGKVRFIVMKAFSHKQQIIFLKALLFEARKKIFLIPDNSSRFKNEHLKSWLQNNKEKIEVIPPPKKVS